MKLTVKKTHVKALGSAEASKIVGGDPTQTMMGDECGIQPTDIQCGGPDTDGGCGGATVTGQTGNCTVSYLPECGMPPGNTTNGTTQDASYALCSVPLEFCGITPIGY
ncbi:MAG: hypothetical protein AAGI88_02425 [Pseudomonadota bacterium]